MIRMTHARDLKTGDVMSTDGFVVKSVDLIGDDIVALQVALSGHVKEWIGGGEVLLPVWTPDAEARP